MKTFLSCIFLGLVPLSAAAQECVKLENDLDRLACYDRQSGRTPEIVEKAAPKGSWRVQEEVSKLTDEKDIFLFLEAKNPVTCNWNRGHTPQLMLMCRDKTTSLVFNTQCHMASGVGGYGQVTYRIDDAKAKTVEMDSSTDNRAIGLWSGGSSIPVLKAMIGASQLVAKMTPYGDSPILLEFDITGLDEAIKPLRTQCGW